MECRSCHAVVEATDQYCGGCGQRLETAGAHPQPCPTCGAPLRTRSNRCPTHGEMDPSWLRCPFCLREGRDGLLQRGELYCDQCAAGPPSLVATRLCPVCGAAQFTDVTTCAVCGVDSEAPPVAGQGKLPPTVAVPRPRTAPLAYLIETEGTELGRAVRLHDSVTTIGRDRSNRVVLVDELASAIHATIRREPDGRFIIADRGSMNGTRVNGRELTEPRMIRDNDEIGVGTTKLVLKVVRPRVRRR